VDPRVRRGEVRDELPSRCQRQGHEAAHGHELRRIPESDASDPQDRERDHRVGNAQLVDDECDEDHRRSRGLGDRAGRAPADVRRLHERVDEQQHAAGDEQGSECVEVREPRADPLAVEQREGDRAQGHGHEQDPTTSPLLAVLSEQPAHVGERAEVAQLVRVDHRPDRLDDAVGDVE
jgi:hypothetical protein